MRTLFVTLGAAAACLLLAGCDQNSSSKSNDVTVSGHDGNVTISANGQKFTMKAGDGKSGNFTMSGDNGHFTMHASDGKQTVDINATGDTSTLKLPGFVAVYPGAKVQSTVIGAGAGANDGGGTFTFETTDSPAAVIAFYKEKSASQGLAQAINMSTGTTTMFSANSDKTKRAIQVVAASSGSGARVQVNWSGAD
ncbi:MAG TPA: hypothetical protein VG274_10295 [Rhizomicrobium sp.]|nr:hypothetical protein [Rhizomicrobium sp.]